MTELKMSLDQGQGSTFMVTNWAFISRELCFMNRRLSKTEDIRHYRERQRKTSKLFIYLKNAVLSRLRVLADREPRKFERETCRSCLPAEVFQEQKYFV
jgi:hypothetical protein